MSKTVNGLSVRQLSRRSLLTGVTATALIRPIHATTPEKGPSYLAQIIEPQNRGTVFHWLDITLQTVRDQRIAPPRAAYNFAMPLVAGFLAANGLTQIYDTSYNIGLAPNGADPEIAYGVAFAKAASEAFQSSFAADQAAFLARFPNNEAKTLGIQWGQKVAQSVIDMRADDGSDASDVNYDLGYYARRDDILRWQPTGLFYEANPALARQTDFRGLFPQHGTIKPWTMKRGAQFRVEGFHDPKSPEFAADFDMLRHFGGADNTERTPDQSNAAKFWENGHWGITPPGHFLYIAMQVLQHKSWTFTEQARAFALLGMALCDASICAWDNKYQHDILRPETAIRLRAHQFNNSDPRVHLQPGWQSFIVNPEFPAFTSGHSTFGAAGTQMTALLLGKDQVTIRGLPPDEHLWPHLKGMTRYWTSLSQVAEDNGMSRIYGGVHWILDHTEAMCSGRAVARQAFKTMFPKKL